MKQLLPTQSLLLFLFTVLIGLSTTLSCASTKPREEQKPEAPKCMRWDEVQGTSVEVKCSGQDQDGDGLDDAADLCPKLAETPNGEQDQDGCPDPDADGDFIVDAADDCPHQAGPPPVGCPLMDSDGDGIVDHLDSCPLDAEDLNGIDDQDGCPDGANQAVVLRDDQLFVQQPIHFLKHSAMLLPDSKDLLERIAKQLAPHKLDISRIRIVGHSDRREVRRRKALALSKTRARIVAKYLILLGIDKSLFDIEAMGSKQPLTKGRRPRDREKNRRVELIISLKNHNTVKNVADAGTQAADANADQAQQIPDKPSAQVAPYDENEDWDSEFLDDDWDKEFLKK